MIIPGGMTKILQPLGVTVNKPVKYVLRAKWNVWMENGDLTFTTGGNQRKPTLLEVVYRVLSVWNELDPAIIKKGFLKCCITNNLDGLQDDILWREEEEENVEDNDDEILYYDGSEHNIVE